MIKGISISDLIGAWILLHIAEAGAFVFMTIVRFTTGRNSSINTLLDIVGYIRHVNLLMIFAAMR